MIENDNIKELFSKSLENHTAPVRPEVWNGLQAKMAAAGVSSVAATKGLSMLTKWIIGSAAVTGTAVITTIAVMNSGSEKPADKAPEQSGRQTEIASQPAEETAVNPEIQSNSAENSKVPTSSGDITTPNAFLQIAPDHGRSGTLGDQGTQQLPGSGPEKTQSNPFGGRTVQDPPVEPGKVVEIPVEKPETNPSATVADPEFKAPVLHFPNVFTPNGDGPNDDYFIDFENVPTATITFMDQNNKTVYTTTDKGFKWDGTVEGDPVPDGTYACIVVYQDMSGKTHKKITLIDIRR